VSVFDARGTKLWQVKAGMGVDGAHWGDLDGDGVDEMIVGMNGGGGLQAWSAEGKMLWSLNFGNVWNQAIVSATPGQPASIFATEAGGSVKVVSPSGKLMRSLKSNGGYYAEMSAARGTGTIQILALNKSEITAFDDQGNISWTSSALADGSWRKPNFASGDLDGDGVADWVFLDGSGSLVVANMKGQRISSIPERRNVESFAIAPRTNHGGVLIVLTGHVLKAYELR
jgi:hypothetical protein